MQSESRHFKFFEEIESYWIDVMNVEPSLLQLSAGPLDFKVRNDDFDGVALTWVKSAGRQLWRDCLTGEDLHFGFVIDSAGPVRTGGRDIEATDALMWLPGHEIDYLLEGPLTSLELSVSGEIAAELGWRIGGQPVEVVNESALTVLLQVCSMASEWLHSNRDLPNETLFVRGRLWKEWILDALAPVITPWIDQTDVHRRLNGKTTRHFEIVRLLEQRLDLDDPDLVARADLVAKDLGISRRSLFYAFQRTLGIGPRKYFELQRLHDLRRALKASEADRASVTELATSFGFTQLGRMAGIYKRHFGETPRETLRKPV